MPKCWLRVKKRFSKNYFFRYLEVNYSHENFEYLDLGQEFDLDDKSFTLATLIRLRPDENLHANFTNRGARNVIHQTKIKFFFSDKKILKFLNLSAKCQNELKGIPGKIENV